ncbi:histidine kinase [Porphyromonadaceae bacterium W3.11]|nr:histidine kinase [Porphyromonadaceae bacterium W3.11]
MRRLSKQPFFLLYDKKTALTAAVILSFVLALVMFGSSVYITHLYNALDINKEELFSIDSLLILFLNTLMIYFLFRFQLWVITRYSNNRPVMWLILVGLFIVVGIGSNIISHFQDWSFTDQTINKLYSTLNYVKDMTILVITFLFTVLIYVINQSQETVTTNQTLAIENLKNKYTALKNQTDPHFLFNSLNTLNGLIGYDDERAHEYVEQLSSVFRFTMKDRSVIRVSEELEFVASYLYLMQIRYDDGLDIDIQDLDKYHDYYILPFGLQILIENAIKHNVISHKSPLTITVRVVDDRAIRVENNLQPRQVRSKGTGVGLSNLYELYQLMFGREIAIISTDKFFAVEIPLIKHLENTKLINV